MNEILEGKKGDQKLLLGNEAIARGALEAGLGMISCYPGTPSSEVVDTLWRARADLENSGHKPAFRAEYSVNEKVAMEVACGAALGGCRSLVAMKHVGLNVAADPMFTAAYTGMPGGLVILSADDPGCHSSQNEQDNRQYARFASLPCFEPSSPAEAKAMTVAAFDLAASLEQPVMLRSTTRISHSRGPVILGDIPDAPPHVEFQRAPLRFVPVPMVARKRHHSLADAMGKAAEIAGKSPFNTVRFPPGTGKFPGVIASGVAREYLGDVLAEMGLENDVAVLELGMTWPLPERMLLNFMEKCDKLLVLEEGAPYLEKDIRALAQKAGLAIPVSGKDDGLSEFGEYSRSLVERRIARWLNKEIPASAKAAETRQLPARPPNLCPGCSHRSVYYAARQVFGNDVIYSSDIGCYTLGMLPPLGAADFLVCMGSSVSAGSGFAEASGKPVVAFIGDSTFFHSGMTGLANAVFNKHNLLVVILDNGTTAMTGHQPNPGMVQESLGENATHLDIAPIVQALGVSRLAAVKANNLRGMMSAMREMRDVDGVRVIIAREPCLLYARHGLKKRKTAVARVIAQNDSAEECFRNLACPAFCRVDGKMAVDELLCGGCMLCVQIAPDAFAAKKAGA